MLREALGYPTRPPRGGRGVLVGGTLLLLVGALAGAATLHPVLVPAALVAVAPWLLVRGYYVRVVRTTLGREHPVPPGFDGVRRLLRDGCAAAAIAAGYLLPGVAVLAPLVYARTRDADLVALLLGDGVSPAVAGGVTTGVGILALFAVFALLGALYVLPVAVANYAVTDRLGAAFDLRTVASGAATEDYVVAWGVSFLLQVLLLPVAYLLKPVLVGFYVHFLVAVAVRYCYGQGVGAALDVSPVEPAHEAATAWPSAGEPTPAVRPIGETEVPALRSSHPVDEGGLPGREVVDANAGRGVDGTLDAGGDSSADGDGGRGRERTERERPEGERT